MKPIVFVPVVDPEAGVFVIRRVEVRFVFGEAFIGAGQTIVIEVFGLGLAVRRGTFRVRATAVDECETAAGEEKT